MRFPSFLALAIIYEMVGACEPVQAGTVSQATAVKSNAEIPPTEQILSATVTADIFSGRPNPTWQLAPGTAKKFMKQLASLPAVANPNRTVPGLGYRGFLVEFTSPGESSVIRVSVYEGLVVVTRSGVEKAFVDRSNSLEQWLLATGKKTIDHDTWNALAAELKRKKSPSPEK